MDNEFGWSQYFVLKNLKDFVIKNKPCKSYAGYYDKFFIAFLQPIKARFFQCCVFFNNR